MKENVSQPPGEGQELEKEDQISEEPKKTKEDEESSSDEAQTVNQEVDDQPQNQDEPKESVEDEYLPKYIFLLVHGTFATPKTKKAPPGEPGDWSQQDSQFSKDLVKKVKEMAKAKGIKANFRCHKCDNDDGFDEIFVWPGTNSEEDRQEAAKNLAYHILKFEGRNVNLILIGHSHGGSIVEKALEILTAKGKNLDYVDSWVTLGSPFMSFRMSRMKAFSYLALAVVHIVLAGIFFHRNAWLYITNEYANYILTALFAVTTLIVISSVGSLIERHIIWSKFWTKLYLRIKNFSFSKKTTTKVLKSKDEISFDDHEEFGQSRIYRCVKFIIYYGGAAFLSLVFLAIIEKFKLKILILDDQLNVMSFIVVIVSFLMLLSIVIIALIKSLSTFILLYTRVLGENNKDEFENFYIKEKQSGIKKSCRWLNISSIYDEAIILMKIAMMNNLKPFEEWKHRTSNVEWRPIQYLYNYLFLPVLNRYVWSKVSDKAHGNDMSGSEVYKIGPRQTEEKNTYKISPEMEKNILETSAEKLASLKLDFGESIEKLHEKDYAVESFRKVLIEGYSDKLLYHTSFYKKPEMIDAIAKFVVGDNDHLQTGVEPIAVKKEFPFYKIVKRILLSVALFSIVGNIFLAFYTNYQIFNRKILSNGTFKQVDFAKVVLLKNSYPITSILKLKIDLNGADFSNSELYGCNFENINLKDAKFDHAKLDGSNVKNTDIYINKIMQADSFEFIIGYNFREYLSLILTNNWMKKLAWLKLVRYMTFDNEGYISFNHKNSKFDESLKTYIGVLEKLKKECKKENLREDQSVQANVYESALKKKVGRLNTFYSLGRSNGIDDDQLESLKSNFGYIKKWLLSDPSLLFAFGYNKTDVEKMDFNKVKEIIGVNIDMKGKKIKIKTKN